MGASDVVRNAARLVALHHESAGRAAGAVNQTLVLRNWSIGAHLVEYEQDGSDRAAYGARLLFRLAADLRRRQVPGTSPDQLERMRTLYLLYPQVAQGISATPSRKSLTGRSRAIGATASRKSTTAEPRPLPAEVVLRLSWSNLVELIRLDDPWKRAFYENECLRGGWSVRELQRQIGSLLYERTGLSTDKRGVIEVTDHFKVTDGVWAVGDCIPGPMLAHKAEDDGTAVAELIAGKAGHVDYNLVPSVVYTNPEMAWVGKNEEELKAAGVDYAKGKFPFMANSQARTNHETLGFVKILTEKGTDKILGAHMIGTGVGEMIAEICVAMEFGAASEDIARTSHAHPTLSEAVRQAAMAVEGWAMQM